MERQQNQLCVEAFRVVERPVHTMLKGGDEVQAEHRCEFCRSLDAKTDQPGRILVCLVGQGPFSLMGLYEPHRGKLDAVDHLRGMDVAFPQSGIECLEIG